MGLRNKKEASAAGVGSEGLRRQQCIKFDKSLPSRVRGRQANHQSRVVNAATEVETLGSPKPSVEEATLAAKS